MVRKKPVLVSWMRKISACSLRRMVEETLPQARRARMVRRTLQGRERAKKLPERHEIGRGAGMRIRGLGISRRNEGRRRGMPLGLTRSIGRLVMIQQICESAIC
jgi:hypothetical protein